MSAIVTGATGNLGQAVIDKFLSEEIFVSASVLPGEKSKVEPRNNLNVVEADLSDENAAKVFVNDVIRKYSTLEVAVLTVGGFAMGSIEETSMHEFHRQMTLNFESAFNVVKPVFSHMKEKGEGRIFLTGAATGMNMKKSKGMTAYGLTKSLIFRLGELLNAESSGTNVFTTVIAPTTIDTPQNRKSMPDADFSKWTKPSTIADAIYYHARGEGRAIRNEVILF